MIGNLLFLTAEEECIAHFPQISRRFAAGEGEEGKKKNEIQTFLRRKKVARFCHSYIINAGRDRKKKISVGMEDVYGTATHEYRQRQ